MKKLFVFIFLMIGVFGCSPYKELKNPASMNYCITIANHGSILCRDYRITVDTMFLFDAGYYERQIQQKHVSDIKMVGNWDYMIIPITK